MDYKYVCFGYLLIMRNRRAFTLVELIVSIGIISLISAVVFFNFPQFNESVALNRAARELTLTLREAQARAVAVTPLPSGIFPSNYGVYISGTPTAEDDGQFLIFSDDGDLKYDATNPNDILIKTITFTRGVQITAFDIDGVTEISGVHFMYYRPDPQMIVSDHDGDCIAGAAGSGVGRDSQCGTGVGLYTPTHGSYGPFTITISRPSSATPQPPKVIEIWRTGQISIR